MTKLVQHCQTCSSVPPESQHSCVPGSKAQTPSWLAGWLQHEHALLLSSFRQVSANRFLQDLHRLLGCSAPCSTAPPQGQILAHF